MCFMAYCFQILLVTYTVLFFILRTVERLYAGPKVEPCYYTLGAFLKIAGKSKFYHYYLIWNFTIFCLWELLFKYLFVTSSDRFTALSPNPVNALLKVRFSI